ncbi:MAG: LPXTG-motif cell wall anchor domain protein, partial [Clostridiales bacterium]|nr:LPXTG-motif cell wall anchor domain protein [Clostridiales bacterium]
MEKRALKKISILIILTFILSNVFNLGLLKVKATVTYASDLFFSEYIEGSSYNKAIEIFNGTAISVDLSQYSVELYSNGSSTVSQTLTLSGTLASGDVYIIADSQAAAPILALADITSAVGSFNGDDSLTLKHNSNIIDVFGQVGFDPGSSWEGITANKTLVRKSSITAGDSNPSDAFTPSIEWDVYNQDDFTHLGAHTMDGFGGGTEQQVADVTAMPGSGGVYAGTEVTLSTPTEGGAIYFTIDGSDPSPGTLYSAPIIITEGVTIKAKATKDGMLDSNISSFTYTINTAPVLESIASARTKPEGTIVRVQGTVSRIKGNNNFIQDGTAGICIYQSGLALSEGDLIEATGTLDDYNGLLEMVNVTTSVISSGNTVTPQEVTTSQVTEGLESQLIIIRNATIGAINTTGNTPITDSTGTINIYKVPGLTGIIEGNVVDVIALVSEFNGTYQLNVARAEDVTLSIPGEEVPVTGITLNAETAEVSVGGTVTLIATVLPANATNRNVVWTSENNGLATVNNGAVTGVEVGTVKITAASEENTNIKDECIITVTSQSEVITIADARTRAQDSNVSVSGVVTAILDNNKIYVQDATAAIVMDVYNLQNVPAIAQGDSVRFYGRISNYRNLLTIVPEVSRIEILSNNNPLPTPAVVTVLQATGETYEARLIKILDATIGAINPTSNTAITDTTGTINIYKIPALTGISEGDSVNVIAIASQYHSTNPASGYQLRVRTASDIEKIQTPDTEKPVITHTPVTTGNIGQELQIKAQVTDNREVVSVELSYRTVGQDSYKTINMALLNGEYTAAVPREDLNLVGLEYYISASDGTNTSTSPEDITHPYQVIISDIDANAPEITDYSPKSGTSTGDNLRPVINVKYSDRSGIDVGNIKLYINGADVTANAVITGTELTYTPSSDFTLGEQTIRVVIPDLVVPASNTQDFTWNFFVGEEQFNFYFGQLHSHTNLSDGTGTPDDAYTWARDNANADFFAVTDHSNSFDNSTGSENITDYRDSTSQEWKQLRSTADRYNVDNEFVAIGGYEMTWSGSTGGWGHINTYNTEWFASRNNSAMTLQKYYEKIGQDVTSISQLNHPGTTFGDFGDFGFWTPAADRVVNLIEVGNGEGLVRGSGYFPSYEYYTRALDKGWHVAPSNNQDNHKGKWVNANTARTVVLAPELTRQSIFEAISQKRVYSTEDENLRIKYTVNNQVMGSILQSPNSLNVSIDINDPDPTDIIGKVSIIVDGGRIVEEKTFTSNTADWDLTLDPQYNYYYVRVDQQDRDIAVTAPVWTNEVTPVGISKVEVSQNPQIIYTPTDIIATIYNNGTAPLSNVLVEFFRDSISLDNKIGENMIAAVSPAGSEKATINWAPNILGDIKIYAQAVINVDGQDKTFTASTTFMVANPEDITKIVIDGGHLNQYVTGDYPGNIKTLASMLRDKNMMLVQNTDALTSEDFVNTKILFLTDPAKTVNYTDAEINAIRDFINGGGTLIITSRADYNDKGVTDPALQSAAQGNRVLEAIGSNLRFNDDEVIDNVSNGGQNYRLYFDDYTSTKYNLTSNVVPGYTYSAYSGCSVILKSQGNEEKIDWLVKGHDTTEILDSDLQGDATPVAMGGVNSLAAEVLLNGGKVIVAGTTFFSDFETATSDNAYSNKQITDNIINWLAE